MRLFVLTLFLVTIGIHTAAAQDIAYAREVIQTLCSEKMKGRGYVDHGDKVAAEFIASEFEKAGLKKFGKNYFQPFTTPVNSFPGKLTLTINGKNLNPGEDFLIEPGSPAVSGTFQTIQITVDDLLQDDAWQGKLRNSKGKFIVVNAFAKDGYAKEQLKRINDIIAFFKYHPDNPAKGTLIVTHDKLTWSGSTELFTKPSLTVKGSALNTAIEKIEITVENKFYKNYESQNVIGYIEGKKSDSLIVFSAHYDHLGMMGKATMFPGANDNASGVAFLLNLAKHYTSAAPDYTTVFIAFGAEEIGLIGSKFFTENPTFPLKSIKFLINFDLAGTGDDGIQVVNGKVYQTKFDLMQDINKKGNLLKEVKIRGEACNSDHCMFHMKGVPCFYIYTLGGIQAYHDIFDRAETLPLTEFEDYFRLVIRFIEKINY